MGRQREFAHLVAFALLLAAGALAQDAPCSGHGHKDGDDCVCDSPLASSAGPGYVGDQCATVVHGLSLTGADVQETCEAGHVCNVLAPGAPVCFSVSIFEMTSSAFRLNLLLHCNSVDATISLHGLLVNFNSTTDMTTNVTTTTTTAYPNSKAPFSFAAHTTHDKPSTELMLTRRQLGYGAYTGMYVCLESSASTTFSLRAATHSCPFTLQPDGKLQLCSGRGTTDTCPHGTCTCAPPYAPPPNWVMTPGLGFDDCSTPLQPLAVSLPQPGQAPPAPASAPVADQGPGHWAFFQLQVPQETFQLQVAAAATAATNGGSLQLFLRHQQLPSEAEGQYDASSDGSGWWRDATARAALARTDPAFHPGLWFVGVYNKGNGSVSYTFTAAVHACPNGCSGRGTCDHATGTCTCTEATSLPPDCSSSSLELPLGSPLTLPPRPFRLDTLAVHSVREHLKAAHLVLTASFTTSDSEQALPAWVSGRPMVLVASAAAPPPAPSATWPDTAGARLVLAAPGQDFSMEVGPWMLDANGTLHVEVWNPLGAPRQVGYTLRVAPRGVCLNDCSGHGTCDEATGLCTCTAPYAGGDCSVAPTGSACAPGSRRPVHRPEARGTCWQACKVDGSGFDEGSCAEWTCDEDASGSGHVALRRKGSELACVEDLCTAGNHTVMDTTAEYTCTKRCTCPEDGSACALEAECLPGTVACLNGKQLVTEPQLRCVEPPCVEGTLRRAYDLSGGAAFAVCVCKAGDPSSCAFSSPSAQGGNVGGVVSCAPGYERQGATASVPLSDGTSILTGGTCGAINYDKRRKGVSGGMVFFYCLLSIFLAAGLVVGGKYGLLWYESYRYGRSVFSMGYSSWPLFGNRNAAAGGADDW